MKEGLEPNKHRIYEGRNRAPHRITNAGFMKEGIEHNQHRIYEGRTRA